MDSDCVISCKFGDFSMKLPEGFIKENNLCLYYGEEQLHVFSKDDIIVCCTINDAYPESIGTMDDVILDINYRLNLLLPEYSLLSASKNSEKNIAVITYKYIKQKQDTTNLHFLLFRRNIIIQVCCIMPSNELLKWSDTFFSIVDCIE